MTTVEINGALPAYLLPIVLGAPFALMGVILAVTLTPACRARCAHRASPQLVRDNHTLIGLMHGFMWATPAWVAFGISLIYGHYLSTFGWQLEQPRISDVAVLTLGVALAGCIPLWRANIRRLRDELDDKGHPNG